MYSQANVRAGKVLREADGPVEMSALTLPSGGKVFAPGCASRSGEPVRSPKNISVSWRIRRVSSSTTSRLTSGCQ